MPSRMKVGTCRRVVGVLVLLAGLVACRGPAPAPGPKRAFFFWRTTLTLSPPETDALARLRVERLYVRLFDVVRRAGTDDVDLAAPVTRPATQAWPRGVELVPVVFLREEVLRLTGVAGADDLAGRLRTAARARGAALGPSWRELVVDCDWTDTSREAFFALLERLDARAGPDGVSLTSTVRLHQVKYRERTGVPPVRRGLLMAYNVGPVSGDEGRHAIFDADRARPYLARLGEYPLPLDLALPLWSWTVHVRGEEVVGLLQNVDPSELAGLPWLARVGPDRFAATETAFLRGTLVREGDLLKADETTPAALRAAADILRPKLPPPAAVALFDLSEPNLTRHDTPNIEALFNRFAGGPAARRPPDTHR